MSATDTRIYSFDVFDTCITRPYLRPTDLFRVLAKEVLQTAGLDSSEQQSAALARLRVSAENRARKQHAALEDISLDHIYTSLEEICELDIDLGFMARREVDLEIASCTPITRTLEQVDRLRPDARIVYISDMYLPSDAIRQMLEQCGFWQNGDRLYVSNEVGKSKHHCSLFHHVAQAEGVASEQMLHTGDNRRADYRMARTAGLRAAHFTAGGLRAYERSVLQRYSSRAVEDFIGLNRALRLASSEPEDCRIEASPGLVHSVIAPFLSIYIAWVLRDAQRNGRERLYFVSRDAQIFLRVAKALGCEEMGIDCRYLYGSRKAWFAPSLQHCNREEIRWAYESNMSRTPAAILRRLDMEPAAFAAQLQAAGYTDYDEELDETRTLEMVTLIENSDIRAAVLEQSATTRTRALRYLESQGLLDDITWSLVDIGWVLNCQHALQRILQSADAGKQVHGYYLGVAEKHVPSSQGGAFSGYFTHSTAEAPGAHGGDWLFHLPSVLLMEHVFTPANHGTVLGYTDSDVPEPLLKPLENAQFLGWVDSFQGLVEDHARALADSGLLDTNLDELMPAANELLRAFLYAPQREDVQGVSWLTANAEQSHRKEHDRSLANPMSPGELFDIIAFELNPRRKRYANQNHAWLNGSAALSGPLVRHAFRAMQSAKRWRKARG